MKVDIETIVCVTQHIKAFKKGMVVSISQSNNHNHFTGKKSRFLTPKRKKKIKKKKNHINKYIREKRGGR